MSLSRRITRTIASPRGLALSATGTALGLCLMIASPMLLTGCGGGSGSITTPGNGISLGRAAVLIGTYKGTQTLDDGTVAEITVEFIPGAATETVTGGYTIRILSPRPGGGNDYIDFDSGTVAGNILADGSLNLVSNSDSGARSRASGFVSVVSLLTTINGALNVNSSSATLTNSATSTTLTRVQAATQTYRANSVAGNWVGTPANSTGLQVADPRTDTPVGPLGGMNIQYTLGTASLSNTYSAAVTLVDPTTGTPYTATAPTTRLYSEYDGNLPTNFTGINNLLPGEFFVVGNGTLPASAGSITIPNVPVVGSVSISLANRAFLFEAGVSDYQNGRAQLGTLYVKLTSSDAIYPFLPIAGIHPLTGGYIAVGHFFITNGTSTATPTPTPTPTPSPTPSSGVPAVGTIQFSNVSSPTNAITTKITDTDASASFIGNILQATLTEKNGHFTTERDLNMEFYAPDQASISVGKTFTISDSAPTAAGQARITYIETAGQQKFWRAQSGTATVTAHDSQHTTFRITGAAMTPFLNAGTTNQPLGTFTIDAAGKF
jgi:hypothetical protein